MGSVLIRNLDDTTILALKQRAAERGSSLEQYLRDRLTDLSRPTRSEFLALAAAIRGRNPSSGDFLMEDIRAWRDGLDDDGRERP